MSQRKKYVFPYVHYPVLPIQFIYKEKETPIIAALIDSGGDSIVIPKAIAQYLGSNMEETDAAKTAGGTASLLKTSLDMVIGRDDQKIVYKNIEVFIVDSNDVPVLVGRHPLFDDFEITFKKKKGHIVLIEAQ
ncbi:MAG TPA: aspartyl protease [Thermoplasmatales archaeon]|nr:aspartyl protease [Thermoplasmatales archaeon]